MNYKIYHNANVIYFTSTEAQATIIAIQKIQCSPDSKTFTPVEETALDELRLNLVNALRQRYKGLHEGTDEQGL